MPRFKRHTRKMDGVDAVRTKQNTANAFCFRKKAQKWEIADACNCFSFSLSFVLFDNTKDFIERCRFKESSKCEATVAIATSMRG